MKKRTLGTNRIFNASMEVVWKAWSDVSLLDKWWVPRGFTQTTHRHEFKSGGEWVFTMHGPNGVDYPNEMVYGEIDTYKKIIMHHTTMPKFTITATFTAMGNERTQVDFSSLFAEQKTCEAVMDFAILGNVEHQMRFEALVSQIVPNEFIIEREFDLDISQLWPMFTQPALMSKWYGPKEITSGHVEMKFERGGYYHFSMINNQDKSESWGKLCYVDIVHETRLIYVNSFSNAKGEITRHPMAPLIPVELLTTINFISLAKNKSKIQLRWYPINALPEEIQFFNNFHDSFKMGWSGSFDRLADVSC